MSENEFGQPLSEDGLKTDAMRNFEANLGRMLLLMKRLDASEMWRTAKSLGRVVKSFSKKGTVDIKRLERAVSKLNASMSIYAETIGIYEWFSVMLVTFFDAYLDNGLVSVGVKPADVLSGRGGPKKWVDGLKKLGAGGYSEENIRDVQHLWDTRNLIIHSQGIPNGPYLQNYPWQSLLENGRVKIVPDQFKGWAEAVRNFVEPTETLFLSYQKQKRAP